MRILAVVLVALGVATLPASANAPAPIPSPRPFARTAVTRNLGVMLTPKAHVAAAARVRWCRRNDRMATCSVVVRGTLTCRAVVRLRYVRAGTYNAWFKRLDCR